MLEDEEIETIERMLVQTNKLLNLLKQSPNHFLEIKNRKYEDMYNGFLALKKGCEAVLRIQKEKKLSSVDNG